VSRHFPPLRHGIDGGSSRRSTEVTEKESACPER
jgi:hypothetical protein